MGVFRCLGKDLFEARSNFFFLLQPKKASERSFSSQRRHHRELSELLLVNVRSMDSSGSQVSIYAIDRMPQTYTDVSQDKKRVPRFASFKFPKAPPPEADRPSERHSREAARRDERSRHHSSGHRSHRDRSRSRERRRERKEHRHFHRKDGHREEVTLRRIGPQPVVRETKEDSGLFIIDRKGDPYNLIYGTIHRYNVPEYRRFGRGSVLGLPRNYRIDRDTSEGNALVIRMTGEFSDSGKLKSKNVLSGLKKQQGKLLRVRPQPPSESTADEQDYLSLNVSSHRRDRGDLREVDWDDEKFAYRSIHGKAKPEEYVPGDLEAVSETDSEDEGFRVDLNEEIKQANAELTRKTQENPTDVDAWLRLIDHQDAVLSGAEESRPLTYAERTGLADIKMSLYEKALKQVGQGSGAERLLLGLLEEGAKLWDTKKLLEKWQTALKANSQFIGLWVRYLDFRQTQFLDFTYDRCLATFVECLKLNRSSPNGPEKVYVQNYLFLRLTLFMRESGFTEHAVGLWQASLELTFFRPEALTLHDDREKMLLEFMDFWESEVARIGEPGAKGWKSGSSSSIDPKEPSTTPPVTGKSLFKSWAASERERIASARLPARSLDELEDDDPYRVIISDDLWEILSVFWEPNAPSFSEVLLDSFLYFCHLPPLASPRNIQTTNRWAGDNFLRNEFMSSAELALDDWFSREAGTDSSATTPFSFPHNHFIQTVDTLFGRQQTWFSSFESWAKAAVNTQADIDPDWVRRALRLLVEANLANDDLAEYALALEFTCNNKEAKKFAKSLLKKRSSNLRLYNSYALMECRSGNFSAAEHVWATTLSMSKSFPDQDRIDNGLLWRTWIWECLEGRDLARASHLLLALPQQSVDLKLLAEEPRQPTFSATNLLKLHSVSQQQCWFLVIRSNPFQFLSDVQEHALAARKANVYVAYTDCLAILSYLTHSLDLEKSLEAYSSAIRRLSTLRPHDESLKSFTIESLHQSRAKLLYHHVRKGGAYKPSYIRAVLTESITLHPHNTIFLSLFAWNESRNRIEERVRGVIRDVTATTATQNQTSNILTTQVPVTSHLFSIYTELNRPVYAGSTLHSVRAAFEKAIADPNPGPSDTDRANTETSTSNTSARSNLSLWKLYILFELSRGNIHRAKDIFYRAVRACPWSKELLMLAFAHLRADIIKQRYGDKDAKAEEGMGFEELRRVYNVLVEKELRVHVDIEGLLDEIVVRQQDNGLPINIPVDEESGDEMQS